MEIKDEKTATNVAPAYIVHDFTQVAPDRSRKDVQTLKQGVESAELIHYPNRVLLYDLYHDVLSMDGFLTGIISKRINAVLNKKIKFLDKSGKEVEDITKLIRSNAGRNLITHILESIIWGISGIEFKVGKEFEFEEVPRKHIKPEKGIITKSQYGLSAEQGFKIDELPFVWVIGKKKDLGLLLACSLYAIYKRGNFGDWAQYVEIFGQPVRIMEYDAYDTKTKEELRGILSKSGNSLAIMIPKQANFSMLDGKSSNGDGKLQQSFKDACNEEMAIAILGNTETTSSSSGSGYAQSKEHGEQQDEITASDLIYVENLLNSPKFFNILRSYGYQVDGGKFEFELDLNLDKLKKRLEIDMEVSEKVPISDDYWYETYRIPKPDNYDELRKKMDERKAFNIFPEVEEKKDKTKKEDQEEKDDLIDFEKSNIIDNFFKKLADFFDQARH